MGGAPIRNDIGVPVLVFQTETDVSFSNGTVRQPDTSTYRLWEVAGAAHFDYYGLSIGPEDTGDGQGAVAVLASMQNPTNRPSANFTCNSPINTGPAHYVLDAAFYRLNRWVAHGIVPPAAPRLQITGVSPVVFATDANGNALGGIRTPAVDAPVATLSGRATGGSSFCFLFGSTVPLTPSRMEALYPSHAPFVSAWIRATKIGARRRLSRHRGRQGAPKGRGPLRHREVGSHARPGRGDASASPLPVDDSGDRVTASRPAARSS